MKNYSAALMALKVAFTNLDKNAEDYKEQSEKYQAGIVRLEKLTIL